MLDQAQNLDESLANSIDKSPAQWLFSRKIALLRAKMLSLQGETRHANFIFKSELMKIKSARKVLTERGAVSKEQRKQMQETLEKMDWFILSAIVDCQVKLGMDEVDHHTQKMYMPDSPRQNELTNFIEASQKSSKVLERQQMKKKIESRSYKRQSNESQSQVEK